MNAAQIGALPRCAHLPPCGTGPGRLGVRYVIEGAALGGQLLARGLGPLAGVPDSAAARTFFTGAGAGTAEIWRGVLNDLALVHYPGPDSHTVIAAAQACFSIFEQWLADEGQVGNGSVPGWNDSTAGAGRLPGKHLSSGNHSPSGEYPTGREHGPGHENRPGPEHFSGSGRGRGHQHSLGQTRTLTGRGQPDA